jgi:hypothetical protein
VPDKSCLQPVLSGYTYLLLILQKAVNFFVAKAAIKSN